MVSGVVAVGAVWKCIILRSTRRNFISWESGDLINVFGMREHLGGPSSSRWGCWCSSWGQGWGARRRWGGSPWAHFYCFWNLVVVVLNLLWSAAMNLTFALTTKATGPLYLHSRWGGTPGKWDSRLKLILVWFCSSLDLSAVGVEDIWQSIMIFIDSNNDLS